ncbi:sugar phosphate exchanger 3-like [Gracilinanus agilis]|uniref:sugar phosphate exchanger 3-like n=1 Tax=Gracilinanus agilis TaxID=191870 RepID=UPI001CFD93A1|nr:sugar phosphate exchanger 3-like [Gracilinanus agilis]
MGNHLDTPGQNFVLGLRITSAIVSNILKNYVFPLFLYYIYQYAFLITASVQFAEGTVIFFTLWVSPKDLGLVDAVAFERLTFHRAVANDIRDVEVLENNILNGENEQDDDRVHRMPSFAFRCLYGFVLYTMAYASLIYREDFFFFWMPFYLDDNFPQAGQLSIWYVVGVALGGVFQTLLSERVQKRSPVLAVCLAIGFLVRYSYFPRHMALSVLLMSVVGLFIKKTSTIFSSTIFPELNAHGRIHGSREVWAIITGIVNGIRRMGAATEQFLTSLLQNKLEGTWIFYFFVFITVCTILFISRLLRKIRGLTQRPFIPIEDDQDP